MNTDRLLLEMLLRRLHLTGALSVPPEDLVVAVDRTLDDLPHVLEKGQP